MKKIFIFTEFIYVFPPLKMQMPQLIFKILDRKSPVWEEGKRTWLLTRKWVFCFICSWVWPWHKILTSVLKFLKHVFREKKSTPYSFLAPFSFLKCRIVGVQMPPGTGDGRHVLVIEHRVWITGLKGSVKCLLRRQQQRKWGFPGGTVVKNLPANTGNRFDSWVRTIPWIGNCNPLQHSCLENSTDRGSWWTTVIGVSKDCC